MRLSPILRSAKSGDGQRYLVFWCPGCDSSHSVRVQADPSTPNPCWTYNGNPSAPTFQPSVLVTYDGLDVDEDDGLPGVCHSFVTDGKIQFLGDCTHKLAGQTVDLPAWDFEYGGTEE